MKALLKKEITSLSVFIYNFFSVLIFLLSKTNNPIQTQAVLVFFSFVLIPMVQLLM